MCKTEVFNKPENSDNWRNSGYSYVELQLINRILKIYDFELLFVEGEINKDSKNKHLRFRITDLKKYRQSFELYNSTFNYYYLGNKKLSADEILFVLLKFERNDEMKIQDWIKTYEWLGVGIE